MFAFCAVTASADRSATAVPQSSQQGQGPIPGANGTMDLNWLQNEMTNWGEWGRIDPWGSVWRPHGTPSWWQPYTRGHWAWCFPGGVVWSGDEPWSWLTDHYGRWNYDQEEGWYWIPDDEWAPAWVCWAGCGKYVGWAPLPPTNPANSGTGTDGGGPTDANQTVPADANGICMIPAWEWNFVDRQRLSSGEMAQIIVPRASNANMLARSVPLTNFTHEQGIIGSQPFSPEMIRQIPGWSIPATPAILVTTPAQARQTRVNGMVPLFMPVFSGSGFPMQEHFDGNLPRHPSTLPDDGVNNPYVPAPLEQWNPTAPAVPQTPWEPYAPITARAQAAEPVAPVQPHGGVQRAQPAERAQPAMPASAMNNYLQERQQMEAFHRGQMQRLQLWQDYVGQNQPYGPMTDEQRAQAQGSERAEYMRQVARQRDAVDGRYDGDSPFGLVPSNAGPAPGVAEEAGAGFAGGGGGAVGK